jgi:hypothetical protein
MFARLIKWFDVNNQRQSFRVMAESLANGWVNASYAHDKLYDKMSRTKTDLINQYEATKASIDPGNTADSQAKKIALVLDPTRADVTSDDVDKALNVLSSAGAMRDATNNVAINARDRMKDFLYFSDV